MYFGIFHGSTPYEGTRSFLQQAHAAYPDRPILNMGYGIWSRWGGSSEARQLEVFEDTLRALMEVAIHKESGEFDPTGYLVGMVWWAAYDWYTDHARLQTMGLYHMDRQQAKSVASALKKVYTRLTGLSNTKSSKPQS